MPLQFRRIIVLGIRVSTETEATRAVAEGRTSINAGADAVGRGSARVHLFLGVIREGC